MTEALPTRIAAKIVREGECWRWTGAVQANGYGRVGFDGRVRYAHRVVYTLLRGPIPAGLQIDHLCRNRSCVNPDHLEPVTQTENVRRGAAHRGPVVWTHCPKGHAYDEENTHIDKRGSKRCRACHRAAQHRYLMRLRGAA